MAGWGGGENGEKMSKQKRREEGGERRDEGGEMREHIIMTGQLP